MKRSLEPELMDSPDIPEKTLKEFHRDLARVNQLLGTWATVERFLKQGACASVLDVGCGDGALLRHLRGALGARVVGVDSRPGDGGDVPIVAADATTAELPRADVAVSVFVAHHLTPEVNVALIRNVGRACGRFVVLDLVRHPLPLVLFTAFLCPLIGREAAVDGRQSIRRAYTPGEFGEIVREALRGTAGRFTSDVSPLLSRQVTDIQF